MKIALLLLLALVAVAIEAKHLKEGNHKPLMLTKKPVCTAKCERVHGKDRDNDDDDDDDDDDNRSRHRQSWRHRYPGRFDDHERRQYDPSQPNPEGRPDQNENTHNNREYKKPDHDDDDHDDKKREDDERREHGMKETKEKYMRCKHGMLFDMTGCPMCICAAKNLCHHFDCARNYACHIFKDGDVERPYCVSKDFIDDEDDDDDRKGCFAFFKHHKLGAIILSGIILILGVVAITTITIYCIKKRSAAIRQQRFVNEKPVQELKNAPPPYYINQGDEEKKVEPTDFVSVPPATPPPRYTSTTSLKTISEEDEKKNGMPQLSC